MPSLSQREPNAAAPPLSVERCDPGQMIRAALMTPDMIQSEDVFVLWAMRLPLEIDAAEAAAILLHAYQDLAGHGDTQERLRELLKEASLFPTSHLEEFALSKPHARVN